jgi:hypothetical protein
MLITKFMNNYLRFAQILGFFEGSYKQVNDLNIKEY